MWMAYDCSGDASQVEKFALQFSDVPFAEEFKETLLERRAC